jgi:hypothetical protein
LVQLADALHECRRNDTPHSLIVDVLRVARILSRYVPAALANEEPVRRLGTKRRDFPGEIRSPATAAADDDVIVVHVVARPSIHQRKTRRAMLFAPGPSARVQS